MEKGRTKRYYKTIDGAMNAIQYIHSLYDKEQKCLTCIDQQHIYETVLVNWEDGEYHTPDILERYTIVKRSYYERP